MRPVTKISIVGIRLAILVLAVYWIGIFTGTHLPKFADFSPDVNDKVKHFSAFFGLATLLCYVTTSPKLWKRFSIIAVVCMSYAAIDEITQGLVPGRVPDFRDFCADTLGILTAISLYATARWIAKTMAVTRPEMGSQNAA
ncbi:VanZ like family protein [Rubripirellula amarantea]|uniref:VanZ like family protein n=1 Tax=Rubripirellula amarantea TaxID=2527999 RepID=A0A5C5WHQ9_9BACT|nr:VanZ family protein [Rubripirellula amarantea]TWT50328.1 VanZ like family protein [Rubripirellula amarantea]